MYLSSFISSKQDVLERAFKSPKLHPSKNPDTEAALKEVANVTKVMAIEGIAREVNIDLMDAVVMYEVNNGDYSDIADGADTERSDYESGMDDAVEQVFEKYMDNLSANWLGINTIETKLWLSKDSDRSAVNNLAQSAAKEIFKQLTEGKTPAQMLANAGIVADDVAAYLNQPTPTGDTHMTDTADLVQKVHAYVGNDFDALAVYEDVDTVVNEADEVLAQSAASRIGLDTADVAAMQMASLDADTDDFADEFTKLVALYKPEGKTKAAPKSKAAPKPAAPTEGAVPTEVFEAMKHCGVGDTKMAEDMGVSRSTYVNYCKGKTSCEPDADQHETIRNELVTRANMLLSALAALDDSEPVVVE